MKNQYSEDSYFLTFEFKAKSSYHPLVTEGHILSWDQFALNEPQIHQGLTKSDVVNWNDDGSFITIENNNFKIAFDRKKGMFESYQVNGKSLITEAW